ncbi:hypothetical protein DNTS_015366 [Danionella cerebrum]|uniref:Uncharacterized protein n=1 Tax=Danionella cerebrum TaxID=2873325 RepID=A0A553NWV8_9TELE|nr:hypothetical protein DNTS_015366 [Danionella translucida]
MDGYSSDRQLSLDLVNVGRQRVDFLPMLEHSGTYRESAVHCGTFAEEIISLVHHVKEHFFRGQGITLNERFGNEMDYSVQDVFIEGGEVEQEEVLTNRPPLNRSQIRPLLEGLIQGSDVGDLRFDLERRRQQLLESVKITIAGGGFPQESLEGQERGSPYVSDVDDQQEIDEWFGQEQSQPFQANTPHQERPTLTRRWNISTLSNID